MLFKKVRKMSQLENQIISMRNEELLTPLLNSKIEIMEEILRNFKTLEDAIEYGYSAEAINNAEKVLEKNKFYIDYKKRRIIKK